MTTTRTDSNPTLSDVPFEKRPRHIAAIMDGNGRWASRQNLPRAEGHRVGTTIVREITEECSRLKIEQLTLYCLSSENWKRPQLELDFLMFLLQQYLIDERKTLIENNIKLKIIGKRDRLPAHVQAEMDKTLQISESHTGTCLCLAINYGARSEIVDAVKQIATQVKNESLQVDQIDEQAISDHLYTAGMNDPDLLIRTAGEMRISNYLLWQISYAEIWVTQRCWPEFRIEDLYQAIRDYSSRERRFGGLNK